LHHSSTALERNRTGSVAQIMPLKVEIVNTATTSKNRNEYILKNVQKKTELLLKSDASNFGITSLVGLS
jgi:hypothetical protein